MQTQARQTKTLLVPTDFSVSSRHAAQTAVTLAQSIDARIEFFHVRNVAEYSLGGAALLGSPEISFVDVLTPEDIEGMWQRFLFHLEGLENVTWEKKTTIGQPASCILNRAYELDADMIVMGRTTRSGILRLLFPDVSRQVVRAAPCTVVTADPDRQPLRPTPSGHDPERRGDAYRPDAGPAWVPTPAFA